jgi:nucleoside-diphosphate-sugar epimerase
MSERVLLAGCGDLGLRVAALLLEQGDDVYALRRHAPAPDGSSLRWLSGDLTPRETLRSLPTGITQLVYLPTPDAREEAAYRAIFIDGLHNVLDALTENSLQRVLFVSSTAVYGEHGDQWVDEATPPAPLGFNGKVLLEAERWLAAQPVRSIALRLAGLYGPGRIQLIERLRSGLASAPRKPVHWTNRIHIDDAAAAIAHLLRIREPQTLYLGVDDTPLPMDELYESLAALIGAAAVPEGSRTAHP